MDPLVFQRFWNLVGYALILSVVVLSLTPSTPFPAEIPFIDKFYHLLAYSVLMLWFAQLYPKSRYIRLVFGLIALGISLELAQAKTGVRSGEVWDAVAGGFGVLLSWGLAVRGMNSLLHKFEDWCLKPGDE
jgi:hypothetical protein